MVSADTKDDTKDEDSEKNDYLCRVESSIILADILALEDNLMPREEIEEKLEECKRG